MKPLLRNLTPKIIFITAALLSLLPFISPAIALSMGLILAQLIQHPYAAASQKATHLLLKISVIGLGFGMNIFSTIEAGKEGIVFTVISIFGVLTLGYLIGKSLKIDFKTSSLISAGTAICGGSAIAALSPVMKANEKQISVALGTVFILNSIALLVFPAIGHLLQLSQSQFGLWCAISIHDTSSVVGAASKYGEQALQIATTVKLARALWIIPVSLAASYFFKTDKTKIQAPYFILLFILAILANTYIPFAAKAAPYLVEFAKAGLSLTLFLIGSGLSFKTLKSVGITPLIQGTTLWILISIASLCAILALTST
ncbi:YeiH family protein [Pedobacter nyackensis]|uniref:YeiH family protein n=1 Tax=Pedobacter nyackensis TaxID=475255 RepID=UPI00292EE5A2|nr:putative sulfate exporter family transporter [Pedobacter nyackensis]